MVSYLRKAEYGLDISFCILKMWCVLKNFGLGAKPRFRTYPLAFYNEEVVSPKNNLFFLPSLLALRFLILNVMEVSREKVQATDQIVERRYGRKACIGL